VEVPNNELVPIALCCAEKGLAMHMDKPAGEEMAPFKQLLDVCKAKNLPFQMGFMFRGNPAFQFCIEAIQNKLIGDVVEIIADMNHCYG
jgi:predicted dehydrogenase